MTEITEERVRDDGDSLDILTKEQLKALYLNALNAHLSKCAEAKQQAAAILDLRDKLEWHPIETAPTNCEFFGWCVNEKGVEWLEPRCRINEDGCVEVYGLVDYDYEVFEPVSSYYRVTHWMPLPESPTHD